MSEGAEDQYFRRVEEHFGRRRGGPLVLSPKDWRLLEKWHDKGIPLSVVLAGINRAFDRFQTSGPRSDRINSLRYCEQEVNAAWEEHRAAHGRRDPASRGSSSPALPGASRHLLAAAAACRAAAEDKPAGVASCLTLVAEMLENLERQTAAGELSARELDQRATDLEAQLRAQLEELAQHHPSLPAVALPPFSPYEA